MLSRVADSIYWMSRYVERAENVARFVDVNLNLMLDSPTTDQRWQPLVNITGDHADFAKRYGPGEAAVQALRAGTDVAMLCHDWSATATAIATVRNARQQGRFDEDEWRASLDRIERACVHAEAPGPEPSIDILGCKKYQRLAERIRARLQ